MKFQPGWYILVSEYYFFSPMLTFVTYCSVVVAAAMLRMLATMLAQSSSTAHAYYFSSEGTISGKQYNSSC